MTKIIDLLFTQECLDKLEELFYTTFYCNTYKGYDNVLTDICNRFIPENQNDGKFKRILLNGTIDTYLLTTKQQYTIDDNVMNNIIFYSVLKLFVDIIMPTSVYENNITILNNQFILPITGNINLIYSIKEKINYIYGEDVFEEYGTDEYINYIKEELTEYFEFNSQGTILK